MPDMVQVVSTSIEAIGYDADSQELFVRFLSGNTYRYHGVPPSVAAAFLAAPSKGSYFNREIKPAYPFTTT
ncbi:MAG: KTSC domain-containing protein [Acidobacteria bacterium]|nr:KTSC domain-containing protein [Acidobacteriota bacterium]